MLLTIGNSHISPMPKLSSKQEKLNNVIIKLDFDNHIPAVRLDTIQITQVLFNLVLNSIGAMPKGGEITIKTWCNESVIFFSLIDNGIGISDESISKIFQPFYTTKPTGQGTGLGLSLSYDIVKAHGGEIKVETKENEGSMFIIQLPDSL